MKRLIMKHWYLILLICTAFFSFSCSEEEPLDPVFFPPSFHVYVFDKDGKDMFDKTNEERLSPVIYYVESQNPKQGYKMEIAEGQTGATQYAPAGYRATIMFRDYSICGWNRKKPELSFVIALSETKKVTVRIAWKESSVSKKYYDSIIDRIYVDDVLMYSDMGMVPFIILTYE